MTAAVKESEERREEKEILTPTQKKNLDETKHKYHRALEQAEPVIVRSFLLTTLRQIPVCACILPLQA